MTSDDLATALRDYLSRDEPPPPLVGPAIQRGRSIRRRRRWAMTASAVAATVAVGGVTTAVALHAGHDRDNASDQSSTHALERYDVDRMPALMEQHTRPILARTADPGPATFSALDDQGDRLPAQYWDKASQLEITYGDLTHSWRVSIIHARSEAEGNPNRYCRDGLAAGIYLSCTVLHTDGDTAVTTTTALGPPRRKGEVEGLATVINRADLSSTDPSQMQFDRTVKVIKSDTLITYVTERVQATSTDPAIAAFATPAENLLAIGTDPELVMPVPPPGTNGCPTWSLPRRHVSCSS